MAVPQNKEELQKAINTSFEKLEKEFVNIPQGLTDIQELEGHSKGTLTISQKTNHTDIWKDLQKIARFLRYDHIL